MMCKVTVETPLIPTTKQSRLFWMKSSEQIFAPLDIQVNYTLFLKNIYLITNRISRPMDLVKTNVFSLILETIYPTFYKSPPMNTHVATYRKPFVPTRQSHQHYSTTRQSAAPNHQDYWAQTIYQ